MLLTTHDLGDIEDLCERLVIIDHGRIIYDGAMQKVKDMFARDRTIHMALSSPIAEPDILFADMPGVSIEAGAGQPRDALALSIRFDRFQCTASEIVKRVMNQGEVIDFRIDEPSLEYIIRSVYEGKMDASALSGTARGTA